jgi:hypothetical protein
MIETLLFIIALPIIIELAFLALCAVGVAVAAVLAVPLAIGQGIENLFGIIKRKIKSLFNKSVA